MINAYLAISIEISFRITQGAGGVAIGTSLTVRGVVHAGSPAFALLHSAPWPLWHDFPTVGATRTLMRGILERLSIIFNEGKASPTDVDSNGSTLFQVNYRLLVPLYMKAAYRPLGCCK